MEKSKRQIAELVAEINVPDRYRLSSTDGIVLTNMSQASGYDGAFKAILIAFKLGFKNGCSYEKHLRKAKPLA